MGSSTLALRDVQTLLRQDARYGEAVGRFVAALDSALPWTRMRRVYALELVMR